MGRLLTLCALLLGLLAVPPSARAEPADIDAAARGVVRVVILGSDGEQVYPISHGSGFAVSPTQIITNAHVIRDAMIDENLRIGIVPSDGAGAVYGKAVAVSSRNDLALVELTGELRLPPLTLAGGPLADSGTTCQRAGLGGSRADLDGLGADSARGKAGRQRKGGCEFQGSSAFHGDPPPRCVGLSWACRCSWRHLFIKDGACLRDAGRSSAIQ